ncbi:MAG: hypothetical protein IKH30_14115 [Clostridia bacterium]|nr:hypothetical protein [Clostridia bacterium]
MSEQEERKKSPPERKPPRKTIVSDPQSAVLKERAWGDRSDEPAPEPCEETYRDGSMKNECW